MRALTTVYHRFRLFERLLICYSVGKNILYGDFIIMKVLKKIIKAVLTVVLVIVIIVAALVVFLSVTEWKPKDMESAVLYGDTEKEVPADGEIHMLTWNIGYSALGKDEDFFMDGGKKVRPDSEEVVHVYLEGIKDTLETLDTDIVFFQELDYDSRRSFYTDQREELFECMDRLYGGAGGSFSLNYSCRFVPYPFPVIGKVNSGLMTVSRFGVGEAVRYQLPISFKWPVRMANLKRGLLVSRAKVEGTDKELVFVNMHLEAYAPAEAKIAQSEMLRNILTDEYEKGNYVIAGGDWNMTFPDIDSGLYPVVDADYFVAEVLDVDFCPEGWLLVHDESVPTSRLLNMPYDPENPQTQYYVIDGYIISPNIVPISCETLDMQFENSDHNPVYFTFSLQK